jgi:hypothetical protein
MVNQNCSSVGLNLSCDKNGRWLDLLLVICGMISMHLCPRQLLCFCRRLGAFAIISYKLGTSVDVFESASERRGADGIDARA